METLPADRLMETWVFDGARAVMEERRSTTAKWRAAARTLDLARREPWTMLGADSPFVGRDAERLAQTAATAELAVQFTVPEATVRAWAQVGDTVERRLPELWSLCVDGLVPEQNASEAARLVLDLPEAVWHAFDAAIADRAIRLTPPKFRIAARAARERVHPTTPEVRHEAAREQRRVWVDVDRDGMAWLGAYLPIDVAHIAMARMDSCARELSSAPDETRTIDQLRADALSDLLTGSTVGGDGGTLNRSISLAITIPALSLLGLDGGPATLDGVGPIPLDMAKRLAGDATSFVRVLTDPITGSVLDMEGRTRRIPKPMRRWLRRRDSTCTFPGCNRQAMDADLDHTRDVQFGGITANGNLAHLCRKHHTLKHKTNWRYIQEPGLGPVPIRTWTSPLGMTTGSDPPPF